MPLIKSASKKMVGQNIKKEMEAGKPQKQSIAIALNTQRMAKKKKMYTGGKVTSTDPRNMGDTPSSSMGMAPHNESQVPGVPSGKLPRGPSYAQGGQVPFASIAGMAKGGHVHTAMCADGCMYADGGMVGDQSEPHDLDDISMQHMASDHLNERGVPKYRNDLHDLDEQNSDRPYSNESVAEAILRKRRMLANGGEVDGADLETESEEDPNYYDQLDEEANKKEMYHDEQVENQPMDSNEHGDEEEKKKWSKMGMVDTIRSRMKR
jgi:hypothetical protein